MKLHKRIVQHLAREGLLSEECIRPEIYACAESIVLKELRKQGAK